MITIANAQDFNTGYTKGLSCIAQGMSEEDCIASETRQDIIEGIKAAYLDNLKKQFSDSLKAMKSPTSKSIQDSYELSVKLKSRLAKVSDASVDSSTEDTTKLAEELNSLLAEEYQAWYQYWNVMNFLVGKERPSIAKFFEEAAKDELEDHAAKLLNRLSELGAACVLDTPESWAVHAKSKFATATYDTLSQLAINTQAELEAIEHYKQVIALAESVNDVVTAELLKDILADEQEHYSKLSDFKNDITV